MGRLRTLLAAALVLGACGGERGQAAPTTTSLLAYEGVDWIDLPAAGFAVFDGPTATLHAFDGSVLARAHQPVADEVLSGAERRTLGVRHGNVLVAEDPDPAEAPPGCDEAAGGGGLRVALCGGEAQLRDQVVAVAPDGSTRVVAGPLDARLGHWRWALPSPDGRWALAQWSGECEVPSAHLLRPDGSELREVAGGVESFGLGWAPDGRAVVQLWPGLCGSGAEVPGVHLLDPGTGELELVLELEETLSVTTWRQVPDGNEAERIAARAIAELGLAGCCGEPSHGGRGATAGVVWDGALVAITARPAGEPAEGRSFTCGSYVWTFSAFGEVEPVPDDAALRDAAEAIVPRLYCTVASP
jgi:hypothetical protein